MIELIDNFLGTIFNAISAFIETYPYFFSFSYLIFIIILFAIFFKIFKDYY